MQGPPVDSRLLLLLLILPKSYNCLKPALRGKVDTRSHGHWHGEAPNLSYLSQHTSQDDDNHPETYIIVEWYVAMSRCESTKEHQKHIMCSKEIGLHAHNMLTILSSIVNMMEGPIWPVNEQGNLHFDNKWDFHMSFDNYEANGYMHDLDLLIISH